MWYKSTIIRSLSVLAALLIFCWCEYLPAGETDPVLEYYWQKAGETAALANPNRPGVSYRLTVKSYRRTVGEAGKITKTDSALQLFHYRDGQLDSVTTLRGTAGKFKNLNLFWPTIFEMDYHLNLFPNDTGGAALAIEMNADSSAADQPDGLVTVDRYRYYLRSLYLYYPHKEGFRRYTTSYRFKDVDGYVFPDSVWVVATQLGVFYSDSYRLESGVTEIEILQTPDS